jgi:hypothetical protein
MTPGDYTAADVEELARQRVNTERATAADARREQEFTAAAAHSESVDELAVRLLLLKSLEGAVAESISRTKELLTGRMSVGDMKRPRIGDGPAGSVTYTSGSLSASVTDVAAFTAWVEQFYTTELELVVSVRPAFTTAVLEASKTAGQPMAPDGELDVPGITVRRGAPYVMARPDKARAAELWLEARANPLRLITAQEQP